MKFQKITSLILMLMASVSVFAQNPIVRDQYSADPTARVFGDRVYLFPSHDIVAPAEARQNWFCMADYHVFSSDNLTDWTDHGVIVSQENVEWGNPKGYAMWAPDCVEKDGKYYFYFPDSPKRGFGFSVGVAIADMPEGPYKLQPEPLKGVNGIDPCVMQCSNGDAYIFFGGGSINVAKMTPDLLGIEGKPERITTLPKGFVEGPFGFEKDGKYYLTFPWVEKKTETLAYAMSDNPMGPYEFKGKIMEESPTGCWTNHHSIVKYHDQWYLFYHHNDYSPNFDKLRSVRCDSLFFNEDGTIRPVKPTLRGVGLSSARKPVQVDRYSTISESGTSIDFLCGNDTTRRFEGWYITYRGEQAYSTYSNVDFGKQQANTITVRVKAPQGAILTVTNMTQPNFGGARRGGGQRPQGQGAPQGGNRPQGQAGQGAPQGGFGGFGGGFGGFGGFPGMNTITNITVPKSSDFIIITVPVNNSPRGGVADLKLQSKDGRELSVDWIGFDMQPDLHAPVISMSPLKPWDKGGFETGKYRNVFAEMGYSQQQIDAKVQELFDAVFTGPNRVYFEDGDDKAFISDVKNHDVRTEGMSYGLMIAVQFDRRDIFDRLWRWSKEHMQFKDGAQKGYFSWSLKPDGSGAAGGPASDGELYFITSLIFASNRWGNTGDINYLKEAQYILDCVTGKDGQKQLIDPTTKLITFVPGANYTDPSYHLPAFYEVWAKWANDGRSDYWNECARVAREYLHKSVHPVTGLNPDYNNYDGSMRGEKGGANNFRYDSWRVPMNIALDYSWSNADREWQTSYGHRLQDFLYREGVHSFLDQYEVDGTHPTDIMGAGGFRELRHTPGFIATSAALSLVCIHAKAREFVDEFWNNELVPDHAGYVDYYFEGLMRLFAAMHLSGRYQVIAPQAKALKAATGKASAAKSTAGNAPAKKAPARSAKK